MKNIDPQQAIDCLAAIVEAWNQPSNGDPAAVIARLCDPMADACTLIADDTE